jgi:hypothetical protein
MTQHSNFSRNAMTLFPIIASSDAPLEVGAAAGCAAREYGYKWQSPIKKSDSHKNE